MATTTHATRLDAGRRVFTRIVVGIDGSQQALEAARQAALLQDVDGRLTLFSAWDIAPTIIGGTGNRDPLLLRRGAAADDRREGPASPRATTSPPTPPRPASSCAARPSRSCSRRSSATRTRSSRSAAAAPAPARHRRRLCRDRDRPQGTLLGPRRSSCRQRLPAPRRRRCRRLGRVGSGLRRRALHQRRFSAELHAVVAWGGKGVNEQLVATITDGDHDDRREGPAGALAAAAETADLVIVGSRGLHGLRALGSVSERVAHSAPCSTLVVREPTWQRVAEELGR